MSQKKDKIVINGNIFKKKHIGGTSHVFLSEDKKKIYKKIVKYDDYDVLKREIFFYKLLKNFDWLPKLYHYGNNYMVVEYCGKQINKKNIPNNYKEQILKILDDLKSMNIRHNDLYCSDEKVNITVKNGKLFVIDFGWASINDDFSCGIGLDSKKKPKGIIKDDEVLKKLNKLYKKK